MRVEVVAAERAKEVRDAARAWHRAGFVGEEVLSRIVSRYPDDRQRFGPGFRALAFIFTIVATWAVVGLSFALLKPNRGSGAVCFLLWAAVLSALTEFQRGRGKRANAGSESATALMAAVLAIAGVVIGADGLSSSHAFARLFLAASCATCLIAAWYWGDRLFFAGAGLAGFGLLTQLDRGRLLWIVVSLFLIPACLKAARSSRLAPSHRNGAVILGAVAILALYGAIHIWSLDQRGIESLRPVGVSYSEAGESLPFRSLAILATALLPPSLLLIGWRRREPLLLYAGLLLIGVSIATIRLYHAIMPLSFALILIGAFCLALALWVRLWLRSGEGGERAGFTADPLFDNTNRTEAIQSVVAMASFTPAAQAAPSRPAFEGGGGGFGGGGATGNY